MAEELTPKQKEIRKEQEKLTAELKELKNQATSMRSEFSNFKSAMVEMTRSIDRLKAPFLSHAASVLESIATYDQKTKLQQQDIQLTKTQIALQQKAAQAAQANIDAEYDKVRSINAQIGIFEQQESLAIEQGNAINEELLLLEQKNKLLKSEIANMDSNIPEQEAAAKEKLEGMRSEIARLKELAASPMSNKERSLIDPSLAGMTKAGLQRHIASLEEASAAQESQVAELSRQAQVVQQSNDVESKINELQDERAEWYEQAHGLRKKIWDLEDESKSQLEVANATYDEESKKIKEANKERDKLTNKLRKQEAELKIEKWRQISNVASTLSVALGDFVKTVRDTQNKLGISSGNAVDLIVSNFKQSASSFFTNATTVTGEEILGAQEAFRTEFGGVVSSASAKNLAIQAKELGVTGQELAQARRVFMTTSMGNVGEAKAQTDRFVAEFQKRGLTSKDAMEAITKNSELFARNGNRFAASFVRAAAEAKKIGVDLGKIDQVGDNIIGDFEGFLEKTSELGAMGFGFDSQRLAEIAETGDTGALMGELRSQLAATGKDITNLRRSEQLALSQAFGIPMAELQRLAAPGGGSGEQLTEQEQTNSLLTIIADKGSTLLTVVSSLFGLMAGVQTALLSRIALNTGGGGVASMMKGLWDRSKGFVGGAIDRGKSLFRLGGTATTTVAKEGAKAAAGPVASIASTATSTAPSATGQAGGAASGISKLSSGINPGSLIKGAAAMLIMAGALWVLGKALQQFSKVGLREVGIASVAILIMTGVLLGLGALMSSGFGGAAILLGVFALTLMAGAVWLMGKALQSVGASADGIKTLSSSFDLLATAVGKLLAMDLDKLDKIKELGQPTLGQTVGKIATSLMGKAEIATAGTTAPTTPGGASTTSPTTTSPTVPQVNVDLTRLETKLDQVVRTIGNMKVELDGQKVGRILASTVSKGQQAGAIAQAS